MRVRRRARAKWYTRLVATVGCATLLIVGLGFLFTRLDYYLMPQVSVQTDEMARNIINTAIDQALLDAGEGLAPQDFFSLTQDPSGMVNSLIVNTMLVNQKATEMATSIGENIGPLTAGRARLPIGSLLGIDILAGIGPEIPVTFRYLGSTNVDYESEFRAVGINQVNFALWVVVNASVRVVNPLEYKDVSITRRIAIVDTVFSGTVPQLYLDGTP